MNFTVSSLGPCRLHCWAFGHLNAQQVKPQCLAPTACKPARGISPCKHHPWPGHSAFFIPGEGLGSTSKGVNAFKRRLPHLKHLIVHSGTRRSTPIRACLQKGWQEADAAAPSCSHREARGDAAASGSMASTLTLLLALGGLTCLATTDSASAAELQDKLPHFHPVAADLNQLAESVSTFLLSPPSTHASVCSRHCPFE